MANHIKPSGLVQPLCRLNYRLVSKTMQLSQMQDIAGIRAIVSTADQAHELLQSYQASSLRHTKKITDYIERPRASGYRYPSGEGRLPAWIDLRESAGLLARVWAESVHKFDNGHKWSR